MTQRHLKATTLLVPVPRDGEDVPSYGGQFTEEVGTGCATRRYRCDMARKKPAPVNVEASGCVSTIAAPHWYIDRVCGGDIFMTSPHSWKTASIPTL